MKIKIKNSTLVRPVEDLPIRTLWLSNFDRLHEINVNPTVYLYKPNELNKSFDAKVLKEAMSKVLVSFYPVAGRIGKDENGRLHVNCNNEGVLSVEAETDSTIEDLGDVMVSSEITQLLPVVDPSADVSSTPLFIYQITKFSCGGVSLGIRFHHVIGDATAALYFINTWCGVARGFDIKIPPMIDRTALRNPNPPNPKFPHTEFDKPFTMINSSNPNPTICFEFLKFTPEQLNTLKSKVNNNGTKTKYSTYVTLTAYIWRCASKARNLADDQPTKLYIPIDGRSRLNPPLPNSYFGNVVLRTTPMALCKELLSESLIETAERIRKAIERVDDEYIRSAIDYIEVLDDLTSIMTGPDSNKCPNLNIVSWMWFPFYEADFGMGKPMNFRPVKPVEGKGWIMPFPGDEKNWALGICLEEDHMPSFKKLFYEF